MKFRRIAVTSALVLSCCTAPGQRSLIVDADPDAISLRAHSTVEDEMTRIAARHCSQYGKTATLIYYQRETASGDWLYATYRCK